MSKKITKLKLLPHPHSWQAGWLGKLAFIVTHSHISTIGRSCHKYHFCCDNVFVATNMCLWQQYMSCCVKQNFCHDKIMFVTTKYFLSQQNFCHDKHVFIATKFCHDKNDICGSSCHSYISRQVKNKNKQKTQASISTNTLQLSFILILVSRTASLVSQS